MKRLTPFLAATCLLACNRSGPAEPMSRDAFLTVMADLRRAAATAPSQAEFEAEKTRILTEANVTDSALVAYVRTHAGETGFLAELWDSVAARARAPADSLQ